MEDMDKNYKYFGARLQLIKQEFFASLSWTEMAVSIGMKEQTLGGMKRHFIDGELPRTTVKLCDGLRKNGVPEEWLNWLALGFGPPPLCRERQAGGLV